MRFRAAAATLGAHGERKGDTMKGDGSIISRGRDLWEVQISYGRDPVTGRYERASRTVRGSKGDAKQVRDEMQRKRDEGLFVDCERVTFGEFSQIWEERRAVEGGVSGATIAKDAQKTKVLRAYLGDMRLSDITPIAVDRAISRLRADRIAERGSFSSTTLSQYFTLLKRILGAAVNYDLIARNPCDRAAAPKVEQPEKDSLTRDDAARLLAFVDESLTEEYRAEVANEQRRELLGKNRGGRIFVRGLGRISDLLAVRCAIMTGARRGELFGLVWENVDVDGGALHIVQSLSPTDGLKSTKTRASRRLLSIDGETAAALGVWRAVQASELEKLGIRQGGRTPVLCNDCGGFADLHHFERWWRAFRERAGFPGLTFHELRHTHATLLLGNGADVKTVQARLGHSNASVTLNWYAHAIPGNDRAAAESIANLLGPSHR